MSNDDLKRAMESVLRINVFSEGVTFSYVLFSYVLNEHFSRTTQSKSIHSFCSSLLLKALRWTLQTQLTSVQTGSRAVPKMFTINTYFLPGV